MNPRSQDALAAVLDGMAIPAAVRMYGVSYSTIQRLLLQRRRSGAPTPTFPRGRPRRDEAPADLVTIDLSQLSGVDPRDIDLPRLHLLVGGPATRYILTGEAPAGVVVATMRALKHRDVVYAGE